MIFFKFLHSYLPNPILIDFGFLSIHWYGLLITLAAVAGFFVAWYLFRKYQLSLDHLYSLSFYLIIFGLLGARIYHVLNELPYYWQNPGEILAIWQGGLALHGALIAGVVVIFIYVKKYLGSVTLSLSNGDLLKENHKGFDKLSLTKKRFVNIIFLGDIFAPALVLAQAIGRWGNYFNQELYGLPTDLLWGVPIALTNRVFGFESFNFFHPTFLYESLASLVIFVVLMYLHRRRLKSYLEFVSGSNNVTMWQYNNGVIFSIYLISYSITRILTELIRIDQTPIIFGVRLPIITSGLLIIAGLVVLWYCSFVWKKED